MYSLVRSFHDSMLEMIPHAMSWEVIASMHLTSSSPQLPHWRERSKKRHASQAPWRGMDFVCLQTFLSSIRWLHHTAPGFARVCEQMWAECLVFSYSELEGTFHSPYTYNYANYINMNHEVMTCSRAFDNVFVSEWGVAIMISWCGRTTRSNSLHFGQSREANIE